MNEKVGSVVQEFALIADEVWEMVKSFDATAGYLGNQLVRALDSIGANICEGFGREYPGSVAQFYRYAKGSAMESVWWLDRAITRKLVPVPDGLLLRSRLNDGIGNIDLLIGLLPKSR